MLRIEDDAEYPDCDWGFEKDYSSSIETRITQYTEKLSKVSDRFILAEYYGYDNFYDWYRKILLTETIKRDLEIPGMTDAMVIMAMECAADAA